jgi:hypothetical protein
MTEATKFTFTAEDHKVMDEYAKRAVFCPYCGKRKRGWRAMEADVMCAECDRRVVT